MMEYEDNSITMMDGTATINVIGRGAFLTGMKQYRKELWTVKKRECRNE